MSGFVPVPHDALDGIPVEQWHAVVDLYKRAHALRWRPFSVTEQSLSTRWRMSGRKVWDLLDALVDLGLVLLERGDRRKASRVQVLCPTAEAHTLELERADPLLNLQHTRQYTRQHNSSPPTPRSEDSGVQVGVQGGALQMRLETETRDRDEQGAPAGAPPLLLEQPVPKAPRKRTAKPKAPTKPKADTDWQKPFSDTWSHVWRERFGAGYPWDWWKDRQLIIRAASAAGATPESSVTETHEAVRRFDLAVRAYLAAAVAGTAWPPGPPTVQGFTVRIAEWLLAGTTRTYTRGDHPGVAPLDPATIAELYAGTDPLNPEF